MDDRVRTWTVLSDAQRHEVGELAARYGIPRVEVVDLGTNRFADPGDDRRRPGEVCMVIRPSAATVLVFRKTFYPAGVYRLPTGGIRDQEGIFEALRRELNEETGLQPAGVRFRAVVAYRTATSGSDPISPTYAFEIAAPGAKPVAVDPDEQVEDFKEVPPADLAAIADQLSCLPPLPAPDLEANWRDWGRFRAVIHRIVWERLKHRPLE